MDARTYTSPSCGLPEAVYGMEWGTFWVMHRYGLWISRIWREREGERERESNPLLRQGHLTFLVREWKRNKSPWTDEDEDEDESPREIAREAADREIAPSRLPTRP